MAKNAKSLDIQNPNQNKTSSWAQNVIQHINTTVIVVGALTALVIAINSFWEPASTLVCEYLNLCPSDVTCNPDNLIPEEYDQCIENS